MEQHYANIECELFDCVIGAERFHTYVFGHVFTIESDHKPLNRSTSRIWQIHLFICRECCCDSKTKMSPSGIDLARRCWLLMLSHYAPLKATEIPLDITINPCAHHSWQENWGPDSHPRWLAHSLPCWNKHCSLARWYQWCPTCYMPIPWPQKHPNSWRWPCPLRWSSHHSSIRKEEDPPNNTWRTHGNQLVPKQS